MIQCEDCELCEVNSEGRRTFKCDPFKNIKDSSCIAKWQLIRLDMLAAGYQAMMEMQGKMAPMQDKIFKFVQREIENMDESDSWKLEENQEEGQEKEL